MNMTMRAVIGLVAILATAGCGRSISSSYGEAPNLETWTENLESTPPGAPDPIPAPATFSPVPYTVSNGRDPFTVMERFDSVAQSLRPNPDRPKQALEAFPLDSLKLVGSIGAGVGMSALIKAPDGLVHRVRPGEYMGQNDGRITAVIDGRVQLVEVVRDGQGGWEEREAQISAEEE